jgi:glycine cleavage system aminomethyltransferase T
MGYPFNSYDLGPDRTPLELGLGFFVDRKKGHFIGHDLLLKQKASTLPAKLTGLIMNAKGSPLRSN